MSVNQVSRNCDCISSYYGIVEPTGYLGSHFDGISLNLLLDHDRLRNLNAK